MNICRLQLNQFRNYSSLNLLPYTGLNILYGENAQGKTNILESLRLLSTTRSLRASRESEMIRYGEETAFVQAEIQRNREGSADLQVTVFQNDKKSVQINGLKKPRVLDMLGEFNAVYFGSPDMAIVCGEPEDRRHFLNVEISQISPRYVYDLVRYKRILSQRNRLLRDLRDYSKSDNSGLEVWTEQLIHYGAAIFDKRRFYTARLAPLADAAHRELSDGRESLELIYTPGISIPESEFSVRENRNEERYIAAVELELEQTITPKLSAAAERMAHAFHTHLKKVHTEELRRGATLGGPQRDDILILINGKDARLYGSQGQQRTAALAIKLAEFRLIEDYVGEAPVLLLDDVMSDLDDNRSSRLLSWTSGRCQIFLTCTSLRPFSKDILASASHFHVAEGQVIRREPAGTETYP